MDLNISDLGLGDGWFLRHEIKIKSMLCFNGQYQKKSNPEKKIFANRMP
jgi:hypothetical protein